METLTERLEFAVKFSQLKFKELSGFERQKQVLDLLAFLGLDYDPEGTIPQSENDAREALEKQEREAANYYRIGFLLPSGDGLITYSSKSNLHIAAFPDDFRWDEHLYGKIQEIQTEVHGVLSCSVEPEDPKPGGTRTIVRHENLNGLFSITAFQGGKRLLNVHSDLKSCVLIVLLQILSQTDLPIRRCNNCENLFIATDKRKLFCSKECLNRKMFARWTERHRQGLSDINHDKYEKRIHKKGSAKLKVERRKRNQSKRKGEK